MNHSQSTNSGAVKNTLRLEKNKGNHEQNEKCWRRALVSSSGDVERIAAASSKARIVMELARNHGHLNLENESKPADLTTSNTAPTPIPQRTIQTYPTLVQNQRWQPGEMEEDTFHCRCRRCRMNQCQNREYPETSARSFAFRDNIVRFADNGTMTPKFTDAYCEVRAQQTLSTRTPKTADAFIATSDVDITETVQKQTTSTNTVSMSKKPECDMYSRSYQKYSNENHFHVPIDTYDEPVNAYKCNDYEQLLSSMPRRKFVDTCNRNVRDGESCRKNLYNEGISDCVPDNIPRGCSMRMAPPINVPVRKDFSRFHGPSRPSMKSDYIRVCNKTIGEKQPGMPFTHHLQSKYHHDCGKPFKKVEFRYDDDCSQQVVARSRTQLVSTLLLCDRSAKGKLPKKVLTSKRDIDSFVGNKRMSTRYSNLFH